MGLGQVQGTGPRQMGPHMLYRNVHTGLRQGKEPGPIAFYCISLILCTCPGSVPMQCEIPLPSFQAELVSVYKLFQIKPEFMDHVYNIPQV